ncbi:MAG: hypothetical protein ACRDCE_17990 [Cetobacterium sp.]|uniref:hypothetical protein n=1 Tax=Cetobacterium sp. TaxID=2071632 RepID=UPI003EE72D1C
MNTYEFLNTVINPAREQAGQKPIEYRKFIRKVKDELDELPDGQKVRLALPQGGYNEVVVYNLDKEDMLSMAMRESKSARKWARDRIKQLEADNAIMDKALTDISETDTIEKAHVICAETALLREALRKSYHSDFSSVVAKHFMNGTAKGGYDIKTSISNFSKLTTKAVTGQALNEFKREHGGMNPRDWGKETSDPQLLGSIIATEAKVALMLEDGKDFTTIKERLTK